MRENVSRKTEYKDVYRRIIEIPQRAGIFKVNCSLKVHNAHLKLALSISGKECRQEHLVRVTC